jgi:peptide/nickel transport system permease protein
MSGRLMRDSRLVFGSVILVAVVLLALGANFLVPADPLDMVGAPLLWPGQESGFLLGTDMLGRDVGAGIIHGARTTLMIGLVSALISTGVGSLIGIVSGFYGGLIDDVLSKLIELFQTIPALLLIIALVVIFGSSIESVVIAIGCVSWPPIARLARSESISLKNRDFMQACVAVGMTDLRIVLRHLVPNVLPPILVASSVATSTSILIESGISFLGLGDPNVITWGSMIGSGRELIRTEWYLTAIPGLAILVTVLALNMVTEAVSDALNPKVDDGK